MIVLQSPSRHPLASPTGTYSYGIHRRSKVRARAPTLAHPCPPGPPSRCPADTLYSRFPSLAGRACMAAKAPPHPVVVLAASSASRALLPPRRLLPTTIFGVHLGAQHLASAARAAP